MTENENKLQDPELKILAVSGARKSYLILGLFLVIILAFLVKPTPDQQEFMKSVLGISTFFFGIFIGIFLSDRFKRLDAIRENDSIERSELINLHNIFFQFGAGAQNEIKTAIDRYLMATLDYSIWDYYRTQKEFNKIVEIVNSTKPKPSQENLYATTFDNLSNIQRARNQTISLIEERLGTFEWATILVLSMSMIASLLFINTGSVLSVLSVIGLSFIIELLILIIYDLDNLSWKEEDRIFEPYQRAFETLGLTRYYPESIIQMKRAKKHKGKTYRLAIYTTAYPDVSGKEIKIVKE